MRIFGESETAGRNARKRNNGSNGRRKKRGSCSRDNRDWERREERSSSGEYKQKVTTKRFSPFDLGHPDAGEKSLQAWVEDLLRFAVAQDRKKEAMERQNMEQEDSNSQRRRAWQKIRDPRVLALSPFLAAGN